MNSCLPISIQDLLYLRRVEAPRVELKGSWNEGPTAEQVLRSICAFANDFHNVNGGYVVLGVEERDGVAVMPPKGLDPARIEAVQRWIRGHCRRLDPEYQPILSPEVVDGRHLLVVWAFASQIRPHSAPGRRRGERTFWVRLGAETTAARGAVLTELLRLTARVPFDDQRAAEFTLNDLRATLVREFLQEVGSALVEESDDLEVYRRLQLTAKINDHEVPRNVAMLFFSDHPEQIFRGARIEVVHFRNGAGGDVIEEHIFRGPLHRQVRDCVSYLRSWVTRHVRKHPDRPEASTWESYPLAAIEEAVVNAVHHRGYQAAPDPTKVYVYPDAIEVTSYPGPMPGLKSEHFQAGRRVPQVTARNRRIGELLKELRLAETRSTGVPKIFAAMAANGSPEPRFEFDEERTCFTVVLPVHPEERGEAPAEKVDWIAGVAQAAMSALAGPPLADGEIRQKVRAILTRGGLLAKALNRAFEQACLAFVRSLQATFEIDPQAQAQLQVLMQDEAFVQALARLPFAAPEAIDTQRCRELFVALGPPGAEEEDFEAGWYLLRRRFRLAVAASQPLKNLLDLSAAATREEHDESLAAKFDQLIALVDRLDRVNEP
ncbi:MAG: transcriptional regulator [bacterium]|nr:transcriptional regulator [bacterium]